MRFWKKKDNNKEGEVMIPLKLMRKVNPKWLGESRDTDGLEWSWSKEVFLGGYF